MGKRLSCFAIGAQPLKAVAQQKFFRDTALLLRCGTICLLDIGAHCRSGLTDCFTCKLRRTSQKAFDVFANTVVFKIHHIAHMFGDQIGLSPCVRNDGNAEILCCDLRDRQADAVYGDGAFFDYIS